MSDVWDAFDPDTQFTDISEGLDFPTLLLLIRSLNSLWISKHLGAGKETNTSVTFDFHSVQDCFDISRDIWSAGYVEL